MTSISWAIGTGMWLIAIAITSLSPDKDALDHIVSIGFLAGFVIWVLS
jgi:hypothetical protein